MICSCGKLATHTDRTVDCTGFERPAPSAPPLTDKASEERSDAEKWLHEAPERFAHVYGRRLLNLVDWLVQENEAERVAVRFAQKAWREAEAECDRLVRENEQAHDENAWYLHWERTNEAWKEMKAENERLLDTALPEMEQERALLRQLFEWYGDEEAYSVGVDWDSWVAKAEALGLMVEVPASPAFKEAFDNDLMLVPVWDPAAKEGLVNDPEVPQSAIDRTLEGGGRDPVWLVWAHHLDGGTQLRGVATHPRSLDYMRGCCQREVDEPHPRTRNPAVRVSVERRDPGLNHLYGGEGL